MFAAAQSERPGDREPDPVVYPPPGAFPAGLLVADVPGLYELAPWSIGWEGADFGSARLTITDHASGAAVPLELGLRELDDGYGSNAAMWIPAQEPQVGETWVVRIEGVRVGGSAQSAVNYAVTFVDCGAHFEL